MNKDWCFNKLWRKKTLHSLKCSSVKGEGRTRFLVYPWCLLRPVASDRAPFFSHSDPTDTYNAAQGRDQGPSPSPLIKINNAPRLSQSVRHVKFSWAVCQWFVIVDLHLVPCLSTIPYTTAVHWSSIPWFSFYLRSIVTNLQELYIYLAWLPLCWFYMLLFFFFVYWFDIY